MRSVHEESQIKSELSLISRAHTRSISDNGSGLLPNRTSPLTQHFNDLADAISQSVNGRFFWFHIVIGLTISTKHLIIDGKKKTCGKYHLLVSSQKL